MSDNVRSKLSDEEYLTFVDLRQYVEERMGTENWITLYEIDDSPSVKNARFALSSPRSPCPVFGPTSVS